MYYVQNHGYVETISHLSNAAAITFTRDSCLPFNYPLLSFCYFSF